MRIFDMNNDQIKAEFVAKRFDKEGHIKDGVAALERIQRGDKRVSITVLLPRFRLSYPSLLEAKEGEWKGQKTEPRYTAVALFEPDSIKGLYPFWRATYALASTYLGKKAESFVVGVNNGSSLIKPNEDYIAGRVAKGKDVAGLDQIYVKGGAFLNISRAAKKGPVLLVGKDRQPLLREDAIKELYAGCYCQATIELFAMDDKIATRLVAVMKVGEGDRLSGGVQASVDHFDSVNIVDDTDFSQFMGGNEGAGAPSGQDTPAPSGGLFG